MCVYTPCEVLHNIVNDNNTRIPTYFANILVFSLSFPQHFFCFKATQWCQNSLSSIMTDCLNNMPFHQYLDALGQ